MTKASLVNATNLLLSHVSLYHKVKIVLLFQLLLKGKSKKCINSCYQLLSTMNSTYNKLRRILQSREFLHRFSFEETLQKVIGKSAIQF